MIFELAEQKKFFQRRIILSNGIYVMHFSAKDNFPYILLV